MGSKDEPRVELLQILGLLPVRTEGGSDPLKRLVPVDADDALRHIVGYL